MMNGYEHGGRPRTRQSVIEEQTWQSSIASNGPRLRRGL